MASNPRIDDLRKKLEKDPASRLFAQLAEELRKAGDLDEAIVVSREGLQKHPAYPSARMTLGRALFDKHDLAGARTELEAVLKGAPDNILASRLLAEALEGLGDLRAAVEKYRVTLRMAPGDRQVAGRIEAIEAKLEISSRTPLAPPESPRAVAPAEPAPIPVVAADEPFELERPFEHVPAYSAPPATEAPVAPAPLAAADEAFELERPYEYVPPPPPTAEPVFEAPMEAEVEPEEEAVADSVPSPEPEIEMLPDAPQVEPEDVFVAPSSPPQAPPPGELFEFDAPEDPPDASTLKATAPSFDDPPLLGAPPLADRPPTAAPAPDFVPEPPRMLLQSAEEPPPPWIAPPAPAAPPAPEAPAPELISPTLAELYFNQGFTDKAIEVYQQILDREPANERARARLRELQQPAIAVSAPEVMIPPVAAVAPADGQAARRQAIERVIASLEGLKASLRRE